MSGSRPTSSSCRPYAQHTRGNGNDACVENNLLEFEANFERKRGSTFAAVLLALTGSNWVSTDTRDFPREQAPTLRSYDVSAGRVY